MKTKHLFTFSVLLALTSSGVLLTEVSSTAEEPLKGQKSSSSSEKDAGKETIETKTEKKSAPAPVSPSSNTPIN